MDIIIIEVISLFLLIFFAGFLSAAEVSIASFGVNKIEELKEIKHKTVPAFEFIQKNTESFFGAIQLVNTLSLVLSAMLAFHISMNTIYVTLQKSEIFFLSELSLFHTVLIAVLLFTIIIVVFVTLLPKALGFKYAEPVGKFAVRPLLLITAIFKYPVKVITEFSNFFLSFYGEETSFSRTRLSEDEIRIAISEGVKTGAINETEREIIENVFEFNDLRANEVMIPRTEMISIELTDDQNEITEIIKSGHSLIPVYEDSIDNIVGIFHTKDYIKILIDGYNTTLKSLVRPAYFIPESKLISEILKEMQNRGERLAIVTDEYGGTEGVITMEDILEEIVGEFFDTSKEEIKDYTRLPDGKYHILGSMDIEDFNETFNFELPSSEEYNTIAGFIGEKTGKILNTGETFDFEELRFELIKKIRQKMVQFKVYSFNKKFEKKE